MSQEAHSSPLPPAGTILADQEIYPLPSPASTRDLLRWSLPTVVFQVLLFAAFGWGLGSLHGFLPVYDDLGFGLEGRTPLVLEICRAFESIHVPLWTLAVLGLVLDLGIFWKLLRAGRFAAGSIWVWLVTAGVVVTGGLIVVSVFLPLAGLVLTKSP